MPKLWPQMLAGLSPDPYPLVSYLFQFGWVLPLWGLTQALLGYHFETMAQARAVTRAQALAYDAQLKMLHYQINPHFLFNTLNAISTLVLERRNEQAEQMLLRLAGLLRYSLDRQATELTQLSAEMGDTLNAISYRTGVNVWAIAQANGIYNLNRIYAGQALWIPCPW